jgi:putative ABC transport system ATP-binding protein
MIHIQELTKTYTSAEGMAFNALEKVNVEIKSGEFVAIMGKSGSGKSTLLNMLTGIDRPTTGQIFFQNQAIHQFSENQLALWRGREVGIVFQFFQLLPTLSILENLLLAMDFVGKIPKNERENRAMQLLQQVGIEDQAHKLPATLSGGQQQRAAIARALSNDPDLIVADEPTGNLDTSNSTAIMALFGKLVQSGKTLVVVTHDAEVAAQAQRVIQLSDGKISVLTSNTALQ